MSGVITAGSRIGGLYRVERELGHGATAAVWAAVHVETGERVALKIAGRAADDTIRIQRMLREARATKAIRHPNVLTIHDVIEADGAPPVIVMELLVGEPLSDTLERESSLPLPRVASIGVQIASGLAAAHALGVVHRDLKPANVFLVDHSPGAEVVKLVDFGIAKLTALSGELHVTDQLTMTGALLGTPSHMSPEQVFGQKDIDHRTDLWALGVLLYQALSGVVPTAGADLREVLLNVIKTPIPPLSEVTRDVPEAVTRLVDRLLSRDRDERPSLEEVRAVLAAHAGSHAESLAARPAAPEPTRAAPAPRPQAPESRAVDRAPPKEQAADASSDASASLPARRASFGGFMIVGSVFAGRYRIERLIKAGGMGAVYEVFDENTHGRRALKVMLPSAFEDAELHERFIREVKIAGSIESDHVVRVYDAGVDQETNMPFMVMELLVGEELASLAKRQAKLQRPLPLHHVVDYLAQTARALDKVHQRGIVHRDLKPENLFVTQLESGATCIKVLDFGIAKVEEEGANATATRALGTTKYMAPEQVRGQRKLIGPATDTYALAHIAYTLLAGESYWTQEAKESESAFLLLALIVQGVPEPPVARVKRRNKITLPAAFDAWFLQATSVKTEERFSRATESIAALSIALGVRQPMPSGVTLDPLSPAAPGPEGATANTTASTGDGIDPSPPGENRTGPTGTGVTTRGVTNDSLPRIPVRSGALAGGAIALVGAVVVSVVVWKVVSTPKPSEGIVAVSTSSAMTPAAAPSALISAKAPEPLPSSGIPIIAPAPSASIAAPLRPAAGTTALPSAGRLPAARPSAQSKPVAPEQKPPTTPTSPKPIIGTTVD